MFTMYLFKSQGSTGFIRRLAPQVGQASSLTGLTHRFHEVMTSEKNPLYMLTELAILVLLLHIGVIVYLLRSDVPTIPATPLVMQVSLVAGSPAKKIAAPPASKKPQTPKKPIKKPPVVSKPSEIKKPEAKVMPRLDSAAAAAPPQLNATPHRSSNSGSDAAEKAKAESFTEANYSANYQLNPHPEYPRIARSRRWQGKVLLRVRVSATGFSENVTVHQSSGREPLDKSAVEAVKKWKFIPARRGDTPVASSVIVPIQFTLNN